MSLFAALTVAATWTIYWPRIKAHRVPRRPLVHEAAMTAGAVLAVLALGSRPGAVGALLSLAALAGAGFFLFSSRASRLPAKTPAVRVGNRHLPFSANDSDGAAFSSTALVGRPFVLKFYRGHW